MFCDHFDADLWKTFDELSYFYRQIYVKQVSKSMMQKLEKEITVLVCKMEKYSHLDDARIAEADSDADDFYNYNLQLSLYIYIS
jgi:hypothetical protein